MSRRAFASWRFRKHNKATTLRPQLPWESMDELEEYHELCRVRLEYLVPVREPLALISQIQRSGGTLLSQLFDGHPECHAHPHEICIGKPMKWDWPRLDLGAPEAWFPTLYEPLVTRWVESGYVKDETTRRRRRLETDVFPFLFSPRLQEAIFERCVGARSVTGERDVLDGYFTSYFNAWLDNNNLYSGPKKIVTGFTPRLTMELERVEHYLAAYPDGHLISIVRDPRGWYASASRHRKYYGDVGEALALWRQSTEATIEAAARFEGRVFVLTYEELVEEPEATLTDLAAWLDITMLPELLVPTFNGHQVRANSTDLVVRHGILPSRVDAYRERLDRDTIARIGAVTGDLYERAAAVARPDRDRAKGPLSWAT